MPIDRAVGEVPWSLLRTFGGAIAGYSAIMSLRAAGPARNEDGRNESVNERMDRNWSELLQEMRVTQTGTQILTGFLLAIAFQPRFTDLDSFQVVVYCILVSLAVLTTLLALAPVGIHRRVFRQGRKAQLVQAAHTILMIALIGVSVLLSGTVLLIFDWTVGRTAGVIAGVAVAAAAVVVAVLPRLMAPGSADSDQAADRGPDQEPSGQADQEQSH